MNSPYTKQIQAEIARQGKIVDPRHVEGYMRLEHSTLDGLSAEQFGKEVAIGIACTEEGGLSMAESNAKSFGL